MKNKRRTSGSLDNNLADRYVVQLYKNNPQFIALLSNPADLTVIFSNIELIYQVNQSLTLSGDQSSTKSTEKMDTTKTLVKYSWTWQCL